MGSQVIKVLRQGVWGSVTGGWYFDPRHSKFTNVFHLYTWLILMCLPFIFYMVPMFSPDWAVVGTYAATVFTLFVAIKISNYRLHSMFDNPDVVERKVIPVDNQSVAIDQLVSEDHGNAGGITQATVADAFPVAGSTEALERREQEERNAAGDAGVTEDAGDLANKVHSTDRPVTKRDLEVDVHIDSMNGPLTNNNEISKETDGKKMPKKRRHRQRSRPVRRKAVAFAEVSVQTERRPQIGRCVSLPSASSDTDDDGKSSGTESHDDSTESSEDNESDKDDDTRRVTNLRRRARIRRRAVRGPQKHPWYNRSNVRSKTHSGGNNADIHDPSTTSSGCSDEWPKTADNNNDEKTPNIENGQPDRVTSSRKRTPEGRLAISPQRKLPALELIPGTSNEDSPVPGRNVMADNAAIGTETSPMPTSQDRDAERDHATSDQELLARDPVWRARRSPRYSSDRRLFFRRRSYTVNSNRSRERDSNRRRVSTVPPYNGRRSSPPRRGPSSLQKLMSLWNREQMPPSTNNGGTSSPGQLSPGEVVLTGHSVDNSVFLDQVPSNNAFFPPQERAPPPPEEDPPTLLNRLNAEGPNRPKSESGSHNSNPHCNEVSGSTPKTEAGDDEGPSSKKTRPKKHQPKKARRDGTHRDPNIPGSSCPTDLRRLGDNYRELYGLSARPDTPNPASGVTPTPDSKIQFESSDVDSEEDMKKFVKKLIGATETWQGAEAATGLGTSADLEAGTSLDAQVRRYRTRSSPGTVEAQSKLDRLEVQKSGFDSPENLFTAPEQRMTRRPRHSFPASSESRQILQPRPSAPIPWRARSNSGRRMRHPAGNTGSNTRLTSNTSEEGGAAVTTTLPQISANSVTSTTELIDAGQDDIPVDVIEKLEETGEAQGVHIATEHNDTSAGATHAFQDEHGNWLTYTFGETTGTAQMLSTHPSSQRSSSRARGRLRTHSSVQSADVDTSDEAKSPQTSRRERSRRITFPSITRRFNQRQGNGIDLSTFLESDVSGSFTQAEWPEMTHLDFILSNAVAAAPRRAVTPRVKVYYKFNILPFKSIVLQYDRLALLDLLDRNRFLIENIFAILLALVVAVLGIVLLQKGFFLDIWPLWFCAVIATAQYSLVRSVQPDSASPTHGHNRVIAYSRPVYFCVLALLILLFDYLASDSVSVPDSYIYAGVYFTNASCVTARSVLLVLIMLLPFIFLLGLLPQINTFTMYLTEQTEMHMFGGTASTGLVSALYSLSRSLLFCLPLFGFCYGGMKTKDGSQHILFSVFCGLLVSFSYHLSRQTNNPLHLWRLIRSKFLPNERPGDESAKAEDGEGKEKEENPDELSAIYVENTLSERLQSDLIVCPLIAVLAFAIHCSTAFTVLQPSLSYVFYIIAGVLGFSTHYLLPQLRKQLPWLLFSCPILKTKEYSLFEVQEEAQVMWFEKVFVWLGFFERNIVYPLVIMNLLTTDASAVTELYGLVWGTIILTFIGLKLLRSSYSVTLLQYAILSFSFLFTEYDAKRLIDSTIVTYFLVSILIVKLQDMMLKLQFIYVYVAPWQITWGSAFHAFAQPFSVPHSGMLLLHTTISSILHAPLAPFLGSAVFLTSYVRPLKFWERNYNTKRVDHSNTRLASQIDRGPSSDDNNLNSVFYEHLTLSLQKSLCGDIAMGRWGNVYPGDCFIMASDYLNALVHVIQKGNGVITFQLRGLEFSGTYCQQREVEAISEGVEDNFNCCCFHPGHAKNMLSFNAAFNQRWLAWQVQTTKFVLDGYSITDNSATSMLGVYDLRKILLSYMVKSVIYFLISHDSLEKWLSDESILEIMRNCETPDYVDVDTSFSVTIHDDYDMWLSGISRTKFQAVYGKWITYCSSRLDKPIETDTDSKLVTLCFMVSVLSRRALGTASSHLTASHVVLESFLYGLHSLFKGDFRITSTKDEWVFNDMDLLHNVVAPGVRMSLKLHQDHFQNCQDDEEDFAGMYDIITKNIKEMVITHEADPQWRRAVLSNRTSLLALRHVAGDAVDSYFVITLKRRSQGFRIVRVNKECVKGLWAGQQQELVFLRNSNPERGSIQNAKQVLRNMINSSCDQPIGYPIYVSPVTTSFANTHPQYKKIIGGSMSVHGIRRALSCMWACIQQTCGGGCNSGGSAGIHVNVEHSVRRPPPPATTTVQPSQVQLPPPSVRTSVAGSQSGGSQTNAADPTEQVSVNRMIRGTQPYRSLSHESTGRRTGRSEDYGNSNVFLSSTSLSGVRSSSRWRMGPDGSKISGSRHPSGTGSMVEMAPISTKYILQPGLSSRTSRNSRREGTESPANSDTAVLANSRSSFPSEEARTAQASITPIPSGSGKKLRKSESGIAAPSSSSSSISRGDSTTVITGQLAPPAKPTRKSSGGGLEMEAKPLPHTKTKGESRHKKSKSKPERQKSTQDATEKEIVSITDPSRVFETLEIHRQIEFVKWPNDEWRKRGGRSKWGDWRPKKDTVGEVVFRWYPNHRNPNLRSHMGEVIMLLRVENPNPSKNPYYVPVPEKCTAVFKPEMETTQL